jgi:uncharacterized protein YndB with AHSA1/START domain
MSERTVSHDTFVIERVYDAPVERVFAAWADQKAKAQWFVGPDESVSSNLELDFRIGGRESVSGGPKDGPVFSYAAEYRDIVPNERIVTTYQMHTDDTLMSVSVATVEFTPKGDGTLLVMTESGAFLDGIDNVQAREEGTRGLLDNLEKSLAK